MFESAGSIHVVTGVHTNLVGVTGSSIGNSRIEMHIGNKRNITATCLELCLDITHIHRLTVTLGGKAYKLTTFGHDAQYLLNAAIGIHGTGIGHGLHTNGIGATDGNTTHIDLNRCATRVVKKIHINLSYIHTEAP